ncbi:M48 family metalloprotease [Sphingomonas astaxanthinifaciens]|uniref:Metalloprotease n=1 Tax=Sphingomonas astaxanthinifaciens DSM 22298 TaxID=1123267 RepID=A0ABQ5Z870_9SPHN|nr:M48 family metalloprotease [Sphingomonas astaxanthinifaciens]GLR46989.1 metalloprotease [Sphingomonas astaxanthinifaciens DSM 22298]
MRKTLLFVSAAAVVATPAVLSAQTAYRNLSPRYVQEAQQQNAAVVQEFGGAETGQRAAYVEQIGRRVGSYSGVNPSQLRYTTLNSAVENAFAVPGGYIYITRQLMGIMNDEAELAFVLGHETGHVAANHAQARQQASQRNSIGGILGTILGSVIGGGIGNIIGQLAQTQSQLSTLSFSRQQEYDADRLGISYLSRAGYDPNASATMLSALSRATALEARIQGKDNRSTPEWASTHPLSENRVVQAAQLARQTGRAGTGLRNRDAFLNQIDGVFVDDDPAQGVIEGRTFVHPDLRLAFTVPVGYLMQNSTDAVTVQGSAGQAQFKGGRYTGNLQTYIQQRLQQLTGGRTQIQIIQNSRTTVNGLPVEYVVGRAQTSSGVVDVSVFAYAFDQNTAYDFTMLTQGGQGVGPFSSMVNSVRRISAQEAAAIRPKVIDIYTVRPGDTVQSLASRMAYPNFQAERFLSLNGLAANARLVPGQRVKLVVLGQRR